MTAAAPQSSPPGRSSWARRLFAPAFSKLEAVLELLVCAASLAGIPMAVVLGKLFLAAILAALVMGIGLRFARRRRLPGRMRAADPLDSQK